MLTFWCERAWLPSGIAAGVLVECDDGVITSVSTDVAPSGDMLHGLVLPGFANAHSHAFQRALRGRAAGGDFWAWRETMYALAARLDPDNYYALALATYAEMALAGVTAVGEFDYVHESDVLRAAARDAGIRLTLIDACYLAGGIGRPLAPEQQRFSDGDVNAWRKRVNAFEDDANTRIGVAAHSVRAVAADDLTKIAAAAEGRPLHIHLSEQPAENEACLAAYGVTPTALLAQHGFLGENTTVVHATHLTDADVELLAGVNVCFCPTTERDLADGIGSARKFSRLSLGSDQNAVIDLLAEAQALELDERLASGRRANFSVEELVGALTNHSSLGWQAGRIEKGMLCDLVAVRTDTVRTAGARIEELPLVAGAPDISDVIVSGRHVVRGGEHAIGNVAEALETAIAALT
ncbi:MAG TPA: formimidoylglutamate deiminase [Gaiellaceae bacterium]